MTHIIDNIYNIHGQHFEVIGDKAYPYNIAFMCRDNPSRDNWYLVSDLV